MNIVDRYNYVKEQNAKAGILKSEKQTWLTQPLTIQVLTGLEAKLYQTLKDVAAQALNQNFNHKEWLIKAKAYEEIIEEIRKEL